MTTFLVESWVACGPEILALAPLHYEEASQFRAQAPLMLVCGAPREVLLSVDVARFDAMSETANLHCVVGRDRGRLVAYHIHLLSRSLHYDLRIAQGDVHFILREYRTGRNVIRLWDTVHETLRARGLRLVCDRTGVNAKARPLLDHLGYVKTDETWSRWL